MGSIPTSMFGLNYASRAPMGYTPFSGGAGTTSNRPVAPAGTPQAQPQSYAPFGSTLGNPSTRPTTPNSSAAPASGLPAQTYPTMGNGTTNYPSTLPKTPPTNFTNPAFDPNSNRPAGTGAAATTPTPNAYNPNTVYPGPYTNNADNYKVWLNNQNGGSIPQAPAGTDPNAVSGSSPYMALATGNGPTGSFSLNPQNYATGQYAQAVANQTGGTVTQATPYAPGSPFYTNQPQNLVTEGNGNIINPAVLAQLYGHGYSQSYVNNLVQNYLNGTDAYNPGVADTLGQNVWGYGTNTPVQAAQNFQNGTIGNAQTLASNPNSIPQGFLGPNQTATNDRASYLTNNPNFTPQTSGNGTPTNTPTAGNSATGILSYLMSPQVQGLYGGNPFSGANSAIGSPELSSLLSALSNGSNNGNNLYNIAALLNLFGAGQGSTNSNLNPLFFNNQSQASPQLYYPTFY